MPFRRKNFVDISKRNKEVVLEFNEKSLKILKEELNSRHTYMWKCSDGTLVNVKNMSSEHLQNAISVLEDYLAMQEVIQENYVDAFDY